MYVGRHTQACFHVNKTLLSIRQLGLLSYSVLSLILSETVIREGTEYLALSKLCFCPEKCQKHLKTLLWFSKSDWQLLAHSSHCARAVSRKLAWQPNSTQNIQNTCYKVAPVFHTSDTQTVMHAHTYVYVYICVYTWQIFMSVLQDDTGHISIMSRYTVSKDLSVQLLINNTQCKLWYVFTCLKFQNRLGCTWLRNLHI